MQEVHNWSYLCSPYTTRATKGADLDLLERGLTKKWGKYCRSTFAYSMSLNSSFFLAEGSEVVFSFELIL